MTLVSLRSAYATLRAIPLQDLGPTLIPRRLKAAATGLRSQKREIAQGIEARSDETLQASQPEGREPGPKDAPQRGSHDPR